MHLKEIADALRADDLSAFFVARSEEDDSDQVAVVLQSDSFDDALTLQIIRVSRPEDEHLEGLMLLQFFCPLPVEVAPGQVDDMYRVLPVANLAAPLQGFNVIPNERTVFFRHIALVPESAEAATRVLQSTVWMILFVLEAWGPDLAGLATGDLELDTVLS